MCGDCGGSCRSPAAATGTTGFRPSTGCFVGGKGFMGYAAVRDTPGIMARSAADAKLLVDILTDCPGGADAGAAPPTLAGLRVGMPANYWADIGHEVAPVLDAAMGAIQAAGAVLVRRAVGAFDGFFYC